MWDLVGSLLTGGATGLLGTALTGGLDWLQRRQRHAEEMDLRRLDAEIARIEAAAAERTAAVELETAEVEADRDRAEASYRASVERMSRAGDSAWLVAVDVVRGLLRPVLTLAFLALAGGIYFAAGADEADLRREIVSTVLYLSTVTVVWWFGGRARTPPKRPD